MRRWLTALMVLLLVILGAAAIWFGPRLISRVAPPIRVGILHSRDRPDGDQREIDDRRRGLGLGGDQRERRSSGSSRGMGDRRRSVRLADVRPGSANG